MRFDIRNALEVSGVPGAVVSVVADRQVAATHAFGVKNAATGEPVTEDTVFQAASLSKPVFASAVLALRDAGDLDLDRPLQDYIPQDELPPITARQVLSHTSGLPNWRFEPDEPLECAFAPGARFSYSGEGYYLLQCVVERIAGQGIEAFLQDRVLQPLGMRRSTYVWNPEHAAEVSFGHRDRGQPAEPWNAWQGRRMQEIAAQSGKPLRDWRREDVVAAMPQVHPSLSPLPNNVIPNVAGSLLTTAPEMARFLVRILETDHRALAQPQVRLTPRLSWGLGWGIEEIAGERCFWHWGENGLFENFLLGMPDQGRGIVVLTNGNRGLKVCQQVVRHFAGVEPDAFLWI